MSFFEWLCSGWCGCDLTEGMSPEFSPKGPDSHRKLEVAPPCVITAFVSVQNVPKCFSPSARVSKPQLHELVAETETQTKNVVSKFLCGGTMQGGRHEHWETDRSALHSGFREGHTACTGWTSTLT